MKLRRILVLVLSLFTVRASADMGSKEWISNIIAFGIPLGGYALAHRKGDDEGKRQWANNTAAEVFANSTARILFDQTDLGERPNGKRFGFPSGHMGFVTSGTAFLHLRYGWEYGLPAFLLSGYVAYERLDRDYHQWRDIIAGVGLAYAVAWMIVTPYTQRSESSILPIVGPGFAGIGLNLRW